jgi:hypothetical protein
MSLRTPNSSFIFDLLRRSIKLWAVFRAIFLPATLVADGCFFLDAAVALPVVALDVSSPASVDSSAAWARGFICMILRDLVGGGGNAKASLLGGCWAIEDRRRVLTTSLAVAGEVGEVG